MKNKISLVDINKLKQHEEINVSHVKELMEKIKHDGFLKNPVVIDNKNFVILDGHHRFNALKNLKAKKVPVYLVDYMSKKVRVFLRRKMDLENIKNSVINYALNSKCFPQKTTRHFIKDRPRNININISKLY